MLFFLRPGSMNKVRNKRAVAIRMWQAGQSPGTALGRERARQKNTFCNFEREEVGFVNPRRGGGYESCCPSGLLEQNGSAFRGSLSHEEIGTKYRDCSIMHLWLFIFTTPCSLLRAK